MAINVKDVNGDGYVSDNEGMLACVDRLRQVAKDIRECLDDLHDKIEPTLERWESEGADGGPKQVYKDMQKEWNDAAGDLQEFLIKTGDAIEKVVEGYRGSDRRAMQALS
ncbi:hypothetical protein [Streptomyces sp. NPDC000410]|uniref:WXG100 family type VII secretion target n=1 Tax=Streptomyces sp. NPDC000410 TaxID=3154254 RepID=UPI00331D0733